MTEARRLGHLLMWIGFISATFVSTRNVAHVDWRWYLLTVAAGVAGVVLLRRSARTGLVSGHDSHGKIQRLTALLGELAQGLSQLRAESESLNVYDVRHRIDADLASGLRDFVNDRETISAAYNLQTYADVMSRFATAERNINRAWSASADGYADEVRLSLERAELLMREAGQRLREAGA